MTTTTERRTTCRYLKPHSGNQCTAEAVDPNGEVLLCARHLGLAMEMVAHRMRPPAVKRGPGRA